MPKTFENEMVSYSPLPYSIYKFPLTINCISRPIIFADDASVTISRRNFEDFSSVSNLVLFHMIKWFAANNLVLNFHKTNIMKFVTKNLSHSTLHSGYTGNCIAETMNTKFLGLQIDNHLNWMHHIEQMVPKLSAAHYATMSVVYISNINTL
jgi:hypothetical protein